MKEELPKAYDPKIAENKWYTFWEENGYFKADASSPKKPYSIAIPPPNVTGVLHMGHALVNTLQDILIRYKRMSGFEVLWVPGTDHAGIATQTVVERNLMKETGKRRKDFKREEFLKHVWEWKELSEGTILSQLRRLGSSCDWSRLCFTMDEKRSKAVKTVFKKMFDEGLIYRGDYLVNWDPVTQTALADDEVEYEERASSLWYFRYPIEGTKEHVVIATTRPETMLGDTALAVSPKDERYVHLIGKKARLPLIGRLLPIVADTYVDPTFGTGVVKITPAHDPNDYELSFRHDLEHINIMTPDGRINENGGNFAGLTMQEARAAVVTAMQKESLVAKIDPHTLRVGVSYRSKAVIEPFLSKQWFVKMSAFKGKLRSAVEEKRVTLIPTSWENTYFHWIDNLRDWCISRQLWWGHRIPIWYHKDDPNRIICYAGDDLPAEVAKNPKEWHQDEDVLDTWFSSALWPFSIFGWPEKTADLAKFYPTATLITGHDILFFWVARMICMGEYVMEKPPFAESFLHGLIYGKSYWRFGPDGHLAYLPQKERVEYDLGKPCPPEVHSKWEKMSKSKGNIIDPLEIIDAYGADAMRMALTASTTHARQIDLDRRRFEEYKNFANKIWNASRFVLMNTTSPAPTLDLSTLRLEDKWILSALSRTIQEVSHALDTYAFDRAATAAYDFFWNAFCAEYVEISKPFLFGKIGERTTKEQILFIVLSAILRLMHPMAPFITEELFQIVKARAQKPTLGADPFTNEMLTALSASACIVAPYPTPITPPDPQIEATFQTISAVVRTIRNIRAEISLPPSQPSAAHIIASSEECALIQENAPILHALINLNELTFSQTEASLPFSASGFAGSVKIVVPLPEEMRAKEKVRLTKEREKLIAKENALRTRLSNEDFTSKAPPHLVEGAREELNQTEVALRDLTTKLDSLL